MSQAKEQFERIQWEIDSNLNDIQRLNSVKDEAIAGIKQDLQELYNHILQQQGKQENE
jgi:uncharacterized protein YihD (DUF1040 family)